MTQRQTGDPTGPEHEKRPARRVATPFLLAIGLVVLVMAIVMGVTRPWEGDEVTQRSGTVVPTATR